MINLKPVETQEFNIEGYGIFTCKYTPPEKYVEIVESLDKKDKLFTGKILKSFVEKWDKPIELTEQNLQDWATYNTLAAMTLSAAVQDVIHFIRFDKDTKKN